MTIRTPKLVVLGSINMDLVVRCTAIPTPGQTVMASSSNEFCGGKGANQAVAASMVNAQVDMIGCVGSDAFADRLIENLRQHRVGTEHIERSGGASSGLAVIAVDDRGQNSIMVVAGANACITRDQVENARALIASSDVLLVQLEIPVEAVLTGIQIAKEEGVRVILDPAPALTHCPAELFQVDLICPNESEAAAMVGHAVDTYETAISAAHTLQSRGALHVAVTMGDKGTILLTGSDHHVVPAFDINAVDSTAAGDAFAGALAVHWSEHGCLVDAVRFANAAGALAASRRGAQSSMASYHEIETLWRTKK